MTSFLIKEVLFCSRERLKRKKLRLEPGYFQGHLCQRFMPLYSAKNQNKKWIHSGTIVIMSYLSWYIQLFCNSKNKSDTSWPALETHLFIDETRLFSFFCSKYWRTVYGLTIITTVPVQNLIKHNNWINILFYSTFGDYLQCFCNVWNNSLSKQSTESYMFIL